VVEDGQPPIFPVNFAVDGDTVVFRADPGTKLAPASSGRVAFEVDQVSVAERIGLEPVG
jgi:nitroimidazol reductase NimA-like FMN-containing flavoprotein (pyridoxamine 5'-phosphate oxidase superfamily)